MRQALRVTNAQNSTSFGEAPTRNLTEKREMKNANYEMNAERTILNGSGNRNNNIVVTNEAIHEPHDLHRFKPASAAYNQYL
jgi:hypothetical protein